MPGVNMGREGCVDSKINQNRYAVCADLLVVREEPPYLRGYLRSAVNDSSGHLS